jgi:two-component system, chemotaxis family, protein-glutamate methylesterase/glutaminase
MAIHTGRDIVVVAASAGGLMPLRKLLAGLPADLPASILTVLHIPATGGQALPHILDRSGPLRAAVAVDGEKLAPGRVYVAPPDRHLLVVNGAIRLSRGPRQNGVRPAADPLFRSAALYGGPRTTAVVLSGTLDDAALGCATVERQGGIVAVQDPAEAAYPGMPASALAATQRAIAVPVAGIPGLITRLATEEIGLPEDDDPSPDLEQEISRLLDGDLEHKVWDRPYSGFTCPDCGGPLYLANEDNPSTFDCVVGHTWSPQSLLEEQSVAVEKAMWLAIRALDERARLTSRLASQAQERGHDISAGRFREAAGEAYEAADQMRKVANGLSTAGSELDDPSGRGDITPVE